MKLSILGGLAAASLLATGAAPAASYFVQPIVTVSPGAFINGLEINGAKFRDEGYNNAPASVNTEVDLYAGTIRGNVDFGTATGLGGASQGRFGEQVTFYNGSGTTWDFSFAYEGDVFADARDPNLNSLLQITVEAYVAVFDPSAGATAATWYDKAFGANDQSLFKERQFYDFSNPTTEVNEFLSDVISGSLPIGPGLQSFDIFANLTLVVAKNNNPGEAYLDFRNTAKFDIAVDPGVTYTSLSGVFLDSTGVTVVPLPASAWLLLTGIAGLAGRRFARR